MMSFMASTVFFVFTLSSVVLGLSQVSFFSGWLSLELNMLMFVAGMTTMKSSLEVVSMKYFIVQSIGSSLFLGVISLMSLQGFNDYLGLMLGVSLVLKLGLAPLHGWFVSVISKMSWEFFVLASTVQKILPLFFLSLINLVLTQMIVILSAVFSVMGSLNQLSSKKLLAYSSIFSAAWMVSCEGEFESLIQYLLAYALALGILAIHLASTAHLYLNELMTQASKKGLMIFLMGFLSLGGSPPFLGFYAKILVIQVMLNQNSLLVMSVLVMSSVFMLYVYMRFFYYMVTNSNLELQAPFSEVLWNSSVSLAVFLLLVVPMI